MLALAPSSTVIETISGNRDNGVSDALYPCLVDEMAPMFGFPKMGTHSALVRDYRTGQIWSPLDVTQIIMIKNRNYTIYTSNTKDEFQRTAPLENYRKISVFRAIMGLCPRIINNVATHDGLMYNYNCGYMENKGKHVNTKPDIIPHGDIRVRNTLELFNINSRNIESRLEEIKLQVEVIVRRMGSESDLFRHGKMIIDRIRSFWLWDDIKKPKEKKILKTPEMFISFKDTVDDGGEMYPECQKSDVDKYDDYSDGTTKEFDWDPGLAADWLNSIVSISEITLLDVPKVRGSSGSSKNRNNVTQTAPNSRRSSRMGSRMPSRSQSNNVSRKHSPTDTPQGHDVESNEIVRTLGDAVRKLMGDVVTDDVQDDQEYQENSPRDYNTYKVRTTELTLSSGCECIKDRMDSSNILPPMLVITNIPTIEEYRKVFMDTMSVKVGMTNEGVLRLRATVD